MNCRNTIPMTEFDIATTDETTQLIKALIPYLDFPMQKNLAVMIRFKELKDTIKFYGSHGNPFFHKTNAGSDAMLNELQNYCPKNMADSINAMKQMAQFSNIMSIYKDMEQSPEFENIMNMMNETDNSAAYDNTAAQNILNDEQQKLYNEYMDKLDEIMRENHLNTEDFNE